MVVLGRCCCGDDCAICDGAIYPTDLQIDITGNSGTSLVFDPGGAGSPQVASNGSCDSSYSVLATLVGVYPRDGTMPGDAPTHPSGFAPTCLVRYEYAATLTSGFCVESWSWNGSAWVKNNEFKATKYARVDYWKATDGHVYRRWNGASGSYHWGSMATPEDMGTGTFDCCAEWTNALPETTSGGDLFFRDVAGGTLTVTPVCE